MQDYFIVTIKILFIIFYIYITIYDLLLIILFKILKVSLNTKSEKETR